MMTLYYTLVFFVLMLEVLVFFSLIVPLPFKVKRKLFTFLSKNPIVAKFQYAFKITFIFIFILFIDSVIRVNRVQQEAHRFAKAHDSVGVIASERMEVQARKFYSQRNMYLCGFTLFLSLILDRTYTFIQEILRLEAQVTQYQTNKTSKGTNDESEAMNRLKKELASKDADLQALKSQMEGLSREYNRLGDEKTMTPGKTSPKKSV